ncbi:hypothetical protein [Dyadobacter sp. 3J3]|uniref:hypothetical protein n=1 Tax=Dyadobacter sp. 3J3 TaxID=2606600 RepID=UPI00135AB0EE|nr:hypothetical protein [Dyadobacter sp. 3J3]
MKNFKILSKNIGVKTVFAGLFLLGSSGVFAQQSQECAHLAAGMYQVRNSDKFCLTIEKLPKTQATVELLTEGGVALYGSSLPRKSTKFSQKFDMTNLENGRYILRIRQGQEVISKFIELDRILPSQLSSEKRISLVD